MKYRGVQEEIQVLSWRQAPTLYEEANTGMHVMRGRAQVLPPAATIGYLKVDARPVKQALLAWVTKWIFLFTNYLEGKVHGIAVHSCLSLMQHHT